MMAEKRPMPGGFVKYRESKKESLKTCEFWLINQLMKEFKIENNKLRTHVNEILHSIFFLGIIREVSLTPEDILPAKTVESIKQEFPEPFMKYKSHLPKRTPFSILLDMMQVTHGTKEKVMKELWNLNEKLKSLDLKLTQPARTFFYTLISTVICVCSNSRRTSDEYFGASLGCSSENARKIMIHSSCLNTWHEYVSYAVMSFRHPTEAGEGLQFHESMQCQAYIMDWKNNTYKEIKPCRNCNQLFGLSECTEHNYYYGNCAETECLSKLLFKDEFMREKITIRSYTSDKMNFLKDQTKKSLREELDKIPSLSNMNKDLLCFNPHA